MFALDGPGILILFAIGGLIFGALIMYLILDAVHSRKDASYPTATQPLPQTQQEIEEVEVHETMDDRIEVVSIWKDIENDELLLFQEGKLLTDPGQVAAGEKAALESTLVEAMQWLTPEKEVVYGEKISSPFIPEPVKIDPMIVNSPQPAAPQRNLSIVEQVDVILQEMLEENPVGDQKIRLTENATHGVMVWVGQNYYEGIDEVPDEEVKAIIRKAVQRWEKNR